MPVQLVSAADPAFAEAARALRLAVLRAPWGQPLEADNTPPAEDLALVEDGRLLATGRLFVAADGAAQLRAMAVPEAARGRGLGRRMLGALEARARGRGCTRLWANARSTALPFYRAAGWRDAGPAPTLFGQIPHRRIEKNIDHADYRPWGLRRRPARDADRAALEALIFGALADYGLAPEREGFDRDLAEVEAHYRDGVLWLFEDAQPREDTQAREDAQDQEGAQGRLQASCGLLPESPACWELRRMYLAPALRGRGLGRALLGAAIAHARAAGVRELVLETATPLREARALYAWAGFRPAAGALATQRCDQRMQLDLGAPAR